MVVLAWKLFSQKILDIIGNEVYNTIKENNIFTECLTVQNYKGCLVMNKVRRKELARIKDVIDVEREKLQIVCDEEEDTMMNIPENLQESERYSDMETAVESMEEAINYLDYAIEILEAMV